jgi:hypothetical protein
MLQTMDGLYTTDCELYGTRYTFLLLGSKFSVARSEQAITAILGEIKGHLRVFFHSD